MKYNLQKVLLACMCGALVLSGQSFASQIAEDASEIVQHVEESSTEQSRIVAGSRMLTPAENAALNEERIERAIQAIEERQAEEGLSVEDQAMLAKLKSVLTSEETQEDAVVMAAEKSSKAIKETAKLHHTSHAAAYHFPLSISYSGDTIELEDGSIWSVRWSDRNKTLDWLISDIIHITPNSDWFSSYNYRLVNQNTGASVAVNLALGPIYNGFYTHWIIGIDYDHNKVYLEDGSHWTIDGSDSSILYKWLPNDTIIIGTNDSWWPFSKPNILLNVAMLNHVTAKCLN